MKKRWIEWISVLTLLTACQEKPLKVTYDFQQGITSVEEKQYKFVKGNDGNIDCYSSKELSVWKKEGTALKTETDAIGPISTDYNLSSPSLIYNPHSRQFVLWFQLEMKGMSNRIAHAGVAVSEEIEGPYRFIRSGRINPRKYPAGMNVEERITLDTLQWKNYTPTESAQWQEAVEKGLIVQRDMSGGQMVGDMALFVDEDGKGYHIYISEGGWTVHLAELTEDFLNHSGRYIRIAPGQAHRHPVLYKKENSYRLITTQDSLTAPTIWGPWE